MGSWRDGTTPGVQQDIDGLLDAAFALAKEQLSTSGDMTPTAVVLLADGTLEARGTAVSGTFAASMLAALEEALASDREHLRGVAVAHSIGLDGVRTVQIRLEHVDPTVPALLVSVTCRLEGSQLRFSDLLSETTERRTWV
ncbi:MAG: hypothetical protein ACXVEC_14605 [Nocardioides sp.]